MGISHYGKGKALVFTHENLLEKYIGKDEDWNTLLANIFKWMAPNKVDKG
jgi:hypothetical protein